MEEKVLQQKSQEVLKELRLLISNIVEADLENTQWALNWIDKVNRLSQVF